MTIGKFQNLIIRLVDKISQYSLMYYLIIIISLIVLQLDIFKEIVPIEHIINAIIALTTFTFSTNLIDKLLKRRKPDPRPFLYCPECEDARMRTSGKWICEKCKKIFSDPKKEDDLN